MTKHTWKRSDLVVLALLTLLWGINWPVMKFAVTDYPPWFFRLWTMLLGIAALSMYMVHLKVGFTVPRQDWRRLMWLALLNGIIWHLVSVYAIRHISSGRAAILGYTMPIWMVVLTVALDKTRLSTRQVAAVGATLVGIVALLWDEFEHLAGKPFWVSVMLCIAAVWALGTLEMRRRPLPQVHTLTITLWILIAATTALTVGTVALERPQWRMPTGAETGAIIYTGFAAIAFAHAAFTHLARTLPPVVMGLAMMMTPVVGVFSGVLWLGETLRTADWLALVTIVLAMVLVLKK